jgi:hypothetical protein
MVHGRIRAAAKAAAKGAVMTKPRKRTFTPEVNQRYKVVDRLSWYHYAKRGCCGGVRPTLAGVLEPGTILLFRGEQQRRVGFPHGKCYHFQDVKGNEILLSIKDTVFLEQAK